jgi:hypothetical protein
MKAPPVAAVCAEPLVPEHCHQVGPRPRGTSGIPAWFAGPFAEPKPGERWDDHVEGVFGGTTVRDGIGERSENVLELEDRARPAVREHQRKRVRLGRRHMPERDVQPVEGYPIVRDRVPPLLQRSPVVLPPGFQQRLQAIELEALGRVYFRFGEPDPVEPRAEVGEVAVGNADREAAGALSLAAELGEHLAPDATRRCDG